MLKPNKASYCIAAVAIFALLSGCVTPTVKEQPGLIDSPTLDNSHPRAKLVYGTDNLVGNVRIANLRFRKTGIFTEAQVSVQNLTENRYKLEYKFDWEDSQGFATGNSGSWHTFTLTPQDIKNFRSLGKTPEASNIVFSIREPDDVFNHNNKKTTDTPNDTETY